MFPVTTPIVVILAALGMGAVMWFLAADREPPVNAPENYRALRDKYGRTSQATVALMFGGMMLSLPLGFGIGYGHSLVVQAGVVLLGMLGPPVLFVLFLARSKKKLDVDEYLQFENLHTPFMSARPVWVSKWLISVLLAIGLICAAAVLLVES